MQNLATILAFLTLAALYGVIKPYDIGWSGKRWSRKRFALVTCLLFILTAVTIPPRTPEQIASAKARETEKRRQQAVVDKDRQAEDVKEVEASNRSLMVVRAEEAVTNAARNPSSVEFSSSAVSDDGSLVCLEYRAQNGFGGMNNEYVAFKDGKPHQSSTFWNRNCAHANLRTQ